MSYPCRWTSSAVSERTRITTRSFFFTVGLAIPPRGVPPTTRIVIVAGLRLGLGFGFGFGPASVAVSAVSTVEGAVESSDVLVVVSLLLAPCEAPEPLHPASATSPALNATIRTMRVLTLVVSSRSMTPATSCGHVQSTNERRSARPTCTRVCRRDRRGGRGKGPNEYVAHETLTLGRAIARDAHEQAGHQPSDDRDKHLHGETDEEDGLIEQERHRPVVGQTLQVLLGDEASHGDRGERPTRQAAASLDKRRTDEGQHAQEQADLRQVPHVPVEPLVWRARQRIRDLVPREHTEGGERNDEEPGFQRSVHALMVPALPVARSPNPDAVFTTWNPPATSPRRDSAPSGLENDGRGEGMRGRIVLGFGVASVVLLATTAAVSAVKVDRSDAVEAAIEKGKAKNVILLIGDGMGDSEITLARNYTVGAAGRLALDELPLTGQMTTYSVLPDGKPDYTPESASTSTAWSTGTKTVDGRISHPPLTRTCRRSSSWRRRQGSGQES